jgi:MerR family transcriptional regulator, light-induced transcriptional regulator
MDNFSISDIANMSGIKAHTIRVWEQRYNFLSPERKEGNHRIYSNEDLKHILRIAYLYHSGHRISTLAALNKNDLLALTINTELRSKKADVIVSQLMEATVDFDETRFDRIFNGAIASVGFKDSILKIAYALLDRIGLLWLTDNIIPAQEHFATNLIKRKILMAIDGVPFTQKDDSLTVLFLPEDEHHEVPLLFMQYLLKLQGKSAIYFGANTPVNNLKFYLTKRKATHIYFHLITNLTGKDINDWLKNFVKLFVHQQVVMSGPITQQVNFKAHNLTLLKSLDEMIAYATLPYNESYN